ncbi:beta-1,3-galactosyltransferase 1-like [Asterias rubens]|uniref:beta-1,3-galactosyltransferase 1-like n=1 Tax=Asterias rubens TaxID=7604 RepID=UPI00145557EB|nr:beta-1,3-galactosyltransferase 1-like [Asterias rubens]
MHLYLRNLLILTFVGTLNFFIFMLITGRSEFFLGRSPMTAKQNHHHHSGQRDRTYKTIDSKNFNLDDVLRFRGNKPLQSTDEKKLTKSKAVDDVFIFKKPTRGTRPETTKLAESRPSVIADFINTLKQAPTMVHTRTRYEDLYPPAKVETPIAEIDKVAHINPHNYKLIIDEPNACYDDRGKPQETFLVILISTIHRNFEQRHAIRETWGSPKEINGKKIVTLFLLAYTKDSHLQKLVMEESKQHHDLLQEDFVDSYKNLTLKTMMGMKWVGSHCSHASYFMKTDDDMYVNYANLVTYLSSSSTPKTDLAFGFLINGGPIRDPKSKWFMPKETYPGSRYPPFLSGTGYVMSADVAGKVYKKSLDTGFLYLEDVFVAVCFKSLNIIPKKNKDFNNWRTPYSYCRYRKLITTHMVPPTEMTRIWKDQQRKHIYNCY